MTPINPTPTVTIVTINMGLSKNVDMAPVVAPLPAIANASTWPITRTAATNARTKPNPTVNPTIRRV